MSDVPARVRVLVERRATQRCEYCRLAQIGQEATFHIDHVIPRAVGGASTADNLALACVSCSLRKSARRDAVDPITGDRVALLNPRTQEWSDHFRWEREQVIPITATGRATTMALALNRPLMLAIRYEESLRGRHPPG